jgi:hypothetical protein
LGGITLDYFCIGKGSQNQSKIEWLPEERLALCQTGISKDVADPIEDEMSRKCRGSHLIKVKNILGRLDGCEPRMQPPDE